MTISSYNKHLVCLAILVVMSLNISSYAFTSGIFEFEIINNNQAKIIGCDNFDGGHMSLPAIITHNGIEYPVVEIGEHALSDKNILSIDIPEGITTIATMALSHNGLKRIVLPQSLQSLSTDAFVANDLSSINIPPAVVAEPNEWGGYQELLQNAGGEDNIIEDIIIERSEIPLEAIIYVNCQNLTVGREFKGVCCEGVSNSLNIISPITNFEFLRNYEFYPNEINIKGNNLELNVSIYNLALEYHLNFTEYNDAVRAINNIKKINIECDNLKLGNKAFFNISADINLNVSGTIETNGGAFYGCKSVNIVNLSSLEDIKAGDFQNETWLESFIVSSRCKSINNFAFLGCNNLKEFIFNDSESPLIVGTGMFKDMSVEKLTLGRKVVSGDMPFYGLKSLKTLILSPNISELPDYAFAGCINLTEIYCESANPPKIHKNTFKGVSKTNCKVFVKTNEGEYRQADGWDEFFASVDELENNKQSIDIHSVGNIVSIHGIEDKNISVYSMDGSEIFNKRKVQGNIELTLPYGVYLIVVDRDVVKYFHSKI